MKHIVESRQFDRKLIEKIFKLADLCEKRRDTSMRGHIMASLFYEPSTRTRFSFESAMMRLGGNVITTENAREFSSVAKGETLEDTIRVVNNYADVIVLRHFEKGAAKRAATVSSIPIVNAGDGAGQHPTQSLLDLYTIQRELGRIDDISIAMVGDLKNGRTVRSLAYMLGKYKNVKIFFVAPDTLRIGLDIKKYLAKHHIRYIETGFIEDVISKVDVVYQTRIQKERFLNIKEYRKYKGIYHINKKVIDSMKNKSIIMHPLPRVDEIASEVDSSKKAAYFRQARYGLFIRMALLKYIFK